MALFTARNLLSLLAFSALLAVGDGAQLSMPRTTRGPGRPVQKKATLKQPRQNAENAVTAALHAENTPVPKKAPKSISKLSEKKKKIGKPLDMRNSKKKGSFRGRGSQPKKFMKKPNLALLYKTTKCKHFENSGSCNLGESCKFAHGNDDLRTKEMNRKVMEQEAQSKTIQEEDQMVQVQKDGPKQSMFEASGAQPLEDFGDFGNGVNDFGWGEQLNHSIYESPIHSFAFFQQSFSPISPVSPNGDDIVLPQREALPPQQSQATARQPRRSFAAGYFHPLISSSLPTYAAQTVERDVTGIYAYAPIMNGPDFMDPAPEAEDNHDDVSNRAMDGSNELSVESKVDAKSMFDLDSQGSF